MKRANRPTTSNSPTGGRSLSRRGFMQLAVAGAAGTAGLNGARALAAAETQKPGEKPSAIPGDFEAGAQRLSVSKLREWEDLKYGMFIHFGMGTYVQGKIHLDIPDGNTPISTYNPDKLDVDSWVQIGRDAGMKYAVLTAKHVCGHALWPSRFSDYTVAQSPNTTDVVAAFVKACEQHGLRAGLYYDSYDNHNRFGQVNVSPAGEYPWQEKALKTTYTTSLYQDFQTAQVTELLSRYGPIHEVWIDIPQLLGRGYRTYLYETIAKMQPNAAIMMNSGKLETAWPTDLRTYERGLPPESGHVGWNEIEGKRYYVPGEYCNPIAKNWFYVEGDNPRPDEELLKLLTETRKRGVNFLLDVPPDKHGLIPKESQAALMRLRKNGGL